MTSHRSLGSTVKGVNLLFAHDTEVALRAMAALVNTAPRDGEPDALATAQGLHEFATAWQWSPPLNVDESGTRAARTLREELRALWDLEEAGVVETVNALLRRYRALPQVVRHDEWDWHLHATPSDAPLATRMAVEAAMAMVDVLRRGELDRLRRCAADGCGDVMVDLSKNRSRRFCDTSCANRTNVAAFRARRAAGG